MAQIPRISIVVPFYNSGKFLESCISSILDQTFRDFEIILVDDGSKDDSASVAEKLVSGDSRVRLWRKENGGVSSARNFGLDKASGNYVCFVDSDDELPSDALESLVAEMQDGVDLVIGGYEMYNEEGLLTYGIPERCRRVVDRKEGIRQMYKPDLYMYQGFICSKLFRRNIIENAHLRFDEDIKFNEDRLFIIRYLTAQRGNVCIFTKPVYKYKEQSSSAMTGMKTTFNPAFVTDFTATLRMKCILKEAFHDKEINEWADYGIYTSYSTIHDRMVRSGAYDKDIHKDLFWNMMKSVSPFYLIKKKTCRK